MRVRVRACRPGWAKDALGWLVGFAFQLYWIGLDLIKRKKIHSTPLKSQLVQESDAILSIRKTRLFQLLKLSNLVLYLSSFENCFAYCAAVLRGATRATSEVNQTFMIVHEDKLDY
jgi:hypothetical protein